MHWVLLGLFFIESIYLLMASVVHSSIVLLFVGLTACCQVAVGVLNAEEALICPTLSPAQITSPGCSCQVHISRCVIISLDSFYHILFIKHEIAIQRRTKKQ